MVLLSSVVEMPRFNQPRGGTEYVIDDGTVPTA